MLSPDNYMDVVPQLLANAKHSILIEQQYIRSAQPLFTKLLEAIALARQAAPALEVRIVLGKIFSQADIGKAQENLRHLEAISGLRLGTTSDTSIPSNLSMAATR